MQDVCYLSVYDGQPTRHNLLVMQVMKYSTKGIGSLFKFQMEDILGYPEGAGF
jgi:hypothetical protein